MAQVFPTVTSAELVTALLDWVLFCFWGVQLCFFWGFVVFGGLYYCVEFNLIVLLGAIVILGVQVFICLLFLTILCFVWCIVKMSRLWGNTYQRENVVLRKRTHVCLCFMSTKSRKLFVYSLPVIGCFLHGYESFYGSAQLPLHILSRFCFAAGSRCPHAYVQSSALCLCAWLQVHWPP